MELERLVVVVEEVLQRPDDRRLGTAVVGEPVPVEAVVGEQPARPARQVDGEHDRRVGHEPPRLADEGVPPRPAGAGRAARARVPPEDQQREHRQEEQRAPLDRQRAGEQDGGEQPPPGHARRGCSPASSAASHRRRRASRSTSSAPKVASTNSSRKMSSSAVRERTRWKPSIASSRPAAQPRTVEPNRRRPMRTASRTDSTPATAAEKRQPNSGTVVDDVPGRAHVAVDVLVSERPLADRDEPFAERRVYDVPGDVVLVVPLDALVEQAVRLPGVVRLVEHLARRVGQPAEAQHRGQHHDEPGGQPRHRIVGGSNGTSRRRTMSGTAARRRTTAGAGSSGRACACATPPTVRVTTPIVGVTQPCVIGAVRISYRQWWLGRAGQPGVEERAEVLAGLLLGVRPELLGGGVAVALLGRPALDDPEERVVADLEPQRVHGQRAAVVDRVAEQLLPARVVRRRRPSRSRSYSRSNERCTGGAAVVLLPQPLGVGGEALVEPDVAASCSIDTLSPNHWWASSCATTQSAVGPSKNASE